MFVMLDSTGLSQIFLSLNKLLPELSSLAFTLVILVHELLLLLELLSWYKVHVKVLGVIILLNQHALLRGVLLVFQTLTLLQDGFHPLLHLKVAQLRDAEDFVVLLEIYYNWLLATARTVAVEAGMLDIVAQWVGVDQTC